MTEPARIIQIADERGEFVRLEDGYLYWWPSKDASGALSEDMLRALADELERRNADWHAEICRVLS